LCSTVKLRIAGAKSSRGQGDPGTGEQMDEDEDGPSTGRQRSFSFAEEKWLVARQGEPA
jgi:hypothetical protein